MTYEDFKIDKTKLSRDYLIKPLEKNEIPSREELNYIYNEIGLAGTDIQKLYGISLSKLRRMLKYYNIQRDKSIILKIREQTNLEKYGVSNVSLCSDHKEKMKQTSLKKYGHEFYTQTDEYKEKSKQTNLEKYGKQHFVQTEEFKKKAVQTNQEKYGVDNVFKLEKFQNKAKQTKLEKYGNTNYHNVEKSKQTKLEKYGDANYANREKAKQTCLEKYGADYYFQTDEYKRKFRETNLEKYNCLHFNQRNFSNDTKNILGSKETLEQYIKGNNIINGVELSNKLNISKCVASKYIRKYGLNNLLQYSTSYCETEIREYINQYYETENNTRKYLDGQEIDIYIPKLKLGIEFNGDFWHSDLKKDRTYHQNKSLLAESKGIFIYHIFEYEWNTKKEKILNQLNNLLGINQFKIGARKCEIREVSNKEKNEFLEANHLQGNDNSSIKLGLYYENKLVSLMTFCKPRFNKKYEWELSRFCSLANYNVIGGASKLFKYFINQYNPTSIISYSNIAHTKGNLYGNLGFTLMNISDPNYIWIHGNEYLTRYQCQKHKLLEQGFKGNTEEEIMKRRDFHKLYDCGNKSWVFID